MFFHSFQARCLSYIRLFDIRRVREEGAALSQDKIELVESA
jgi:hypothetical protein